MIEVGEYVRTKNDIEKVVLDYGNRYANEDGNITFYDEVVKHSKNIIDLIEVGEYINGSKLLSIDYAEDKFGNCDKLHFYYSFEDDEKDVNEYYESLKIKSIVTKEMMKSVEYRVE